MPTVTAIFKSTAAARTAISGLTSQGIDRNHVSMLAPGDSVPVEDNKPIKAKVAGGAVGGVLGLGAATLIVPGLGPIVGLGMIAAGLAGAGLGAAAGAAAERTTAGVPKPLSRGRVGRGMRLYVTPRASVSAHFARAWMSRAVVNSAVTSTWAHTRQGTSSSASFGLVRDARTALGFWAGPRYDRSAWTGI